MNKKLFSEGYSLLMLDLSISMWDLGGLPSSRPRDHCNAGLHAVKVAFSSALSVPASRLYRVAVRRSPSMSKTPIRAALWFPHSGRTVRFHSFFFGHPSSFFFSLFKTEAAKSGRAGAKSSRARGASLAGPDRNGKPKMQAG